MKKVKKIKRISLADYANKQTAFQIGAMFKVCGYEVIYNNV